MDGMHDLGGKQGFGAIAYPPMPHDESWEPLVRALWILGVRAGLYNMDEYRHAIERMAPVHYLSAPYYERTLTAVATLLVEKGVVTAEVLAAKAGGAFPLSRPIGPGRACAPAQSFTVGERVRVKNEFTSGHTRMPGYIRGKTGMVVAITPPYPFPDSAGHGMAAAWEPTYDVRFRSGELWPDSSDPALVHVGVFQSYLEKT
jgi:nitrile hydratase subunit beta